MTIETVHLQLVPYAPEHLLALVEGYEHFEECFGWPAADGLRAFIVSDEVSPDWLTGLHASPIPDPWVHGFAVVDRDSRSVVGSVGFKGPPDESGVVEIAYGIVPAFQGRGYATEAAAAGVGFAFGNGVRRVRAHTRPAANASTRVLEKCGFEYAGEVDDSEDGLVWRWERGPTRKASAGRGEASMISAQEALERLRRGNQRFVSDVRSGDTLTSQTRRRELAAGQEPFAIILGCSDSRVPAEIVFDQGLGDLFVIRVAGNIVAPSQVGSAEFAAERFGTRLVVVLGHSNCGAILATLEELGRPWEDQSRNLRSIVDRIRPSVEALLATELRHHPDALVREAVRANIRASANHLRHGSEILEQLIQNDGLLVVGAEYSLETGVVDFFDCE